MDRGIERLKRDAGSDRPVRAIWQDLNQSIDALLDFEYMALANHHDGVRQEIVRFQSEARALQIAIIEKIYTRKGIDPDRLPAGALAFLLTHTSMALVREKGTGFTMGHEQINALMDRLLAILD